jgi:hypothetical protein
MIALTTPTADDLASELSPEQYAEAAARFWEREGVDVFADLEDGADAAEAAAKWRRLQRAALAWRDRIVNEMRSP